MIVTGGRERPGRGWLARSGPTIAQRFDPRANGLTPLRLGLALLVLFSHTYVAGGFGDDPIYRLTGGQMQLGTVAVISFFGLSGFLLGRSRERSSRVSYLRNRALRIVPGLWVCLAFIALVIVPLAVGLGGRAPSDEVIAYVLRAGLFAGGPTEINGLFPGTRHPGSVDSPLWTLQPEVLCYLALAALPVRLMRPATHVVPIVAFAFNAAFAGQALLLHLPVAFAIGLLLYVERDRVPLSGLVAAGVLAVTAVAASANLLPVVGPVTLPYIALWLAVRLPVRWSVDLSYGTYIYAWPIQQLLTVAGVAAIGFIPYLAASATLVVAVALLSAKLVEEPALRLRDRASERRRTEALDTAPLESELIVALEQRR